jgi:hypothetical protein
MTRRLVSIFAFVAATSLYTSRSVRAEGFTDITHESGADAVVDAHYAATPKWWLSGINLIDFDGDGRLDLFLGAHGQHGVIALNDGKGHLTRVDPALNPYPATELHIAFPFLAGPPALQMTHQDGGGLWHWNMSKPGHVDLSPMKAEAGQARENALIDIDRDGFADWVHEYPGGIVIEHGDGQGHFRRGEMIPAYRETSALPVDLNGDGYIDLVLKECGYYDEHTGKSRILFNDGKGKFQPATATGVPEDGVVIQGVGDVNGDGSPDLICLENGKTVAIYLNDGKAHFKKLDQAISGMEKASRPTYANWGLAVVVDLDNDGIPDILMNGRNFLYVLHGTGGGHFDYMNQRWGIRDMSWATVDEGLCFGAIDGDGALDIVGCGGSENAKRIVVYHNDLPKRHWLNVRPIGAGGNYAAAGTWIRLYEPGTGHLLAAEQVKIAARQATQSYYSLGVTERHFGLGDRVSADIEVEFYPSGKRVVSRGVPADQTIEIAEASAP